MGQKRTPLCHCVCNLLRIAICGSLAVERSVTYRPLLQPFIGYGILYGFEFLDEQVLYI